MELPANPEAPAAEPEPITPPNTPAPPPAATIVVTGTKSEREIDLERELDDARTALRKAETDAAYAQDEARRLKEIQSQRPPPQKRSPCTFFENEEA